MGSPGSYKTSVAAKLMHHFGERWDHKRPTSSMSGNGDTFNALRLKLHYAKDCLYWMDDFAPTKSWLEAQRNLEESARLVHNAEERSRTTRDGQSVNDGTGPRASALCTSEVNPRPGSAADRMLVIPLSRHDVDTALLFPLDEQESRHQRALVMASFISWLAADLVSKRERYLTIAAGYADALVQHAGETVRQAAALAHTWIGWVAVTDFLTDLGAITVSERDQTLGRVDASCTRQVVRRTTLTCRATPGPASSSSWHSLSARGSPTSMTFARDSARPGRSLVDWVGARPCWTWTESDIRRRSGRSATACDSGTCVMTRRPVSAAVSSCASRPSSRPC